MNNGHEVNLMMLKFLSEFVSGKFQSVDVYDDQMERLFKMLNGFLLDDIGLEYDDIVDWFHINHKELSQKVGILPHDGQWCHPEGGDWCTRDEYFIQKFQDQKDGYTSYWSSYVPEDVIQKYNLK